MGGALVLLFVGVAALIMLMPKPVPREASDPQRFILWVYDESDRGGPAAVAIVEESRSAGTLKVVTFPAPESARELLAKGSPRKAHYEVARLLDRQIHHRLFLPHSVIATLIDASGGIRVDGRQLSGSEAITYIREGGEEEPARAMRVLLALADSVATNGVNLSFGEAMGLASKLDTDMGATAIPKVLARWTGYGDPEIIPAPAVGPEAAAHLAPDAQGE